MSAIVVLTPIVMGPAVLVAWPMVTAAIVGAVGAMGYSAANEVMQQEEITESENRVDLEVVNSDVVSENMVREEELVFTKGDITVKFNKNIRGKLSLCVTGRNHSDAELTRIGTEISHKVTQQFIYNRVVTELKNADFSIVGQEVGEDETIKIQVRNWK